MKVDINLKAKQLIPASSMKVGQIGIVDGDEFNPQVVLRAYDTFVSLTDPGDTWGNPEFKVELLTPNDSVTLTPTR